MMEKPDTLESLPIAVIGAGPVGLAAAAHLAERGLPFRLFEAGNSAAANVLSWGHVRIFSPWQYNIDPAARRLLSDIGWQEPLVDELPTGSELFEKYLLPLSEHPKIQPFIHYRARVLSVSRKNIDRMTNRNREAVPFVVRVQSETISQEHEFRAVIDASGTWQNPNPILSDGTWTSVETTSSDAITYGIVNVADVPDRYKNKEVLVIGSGHSAINSILDLESLKQQFPETEIHWVMRKDTLSEVYGGGESDALEARGALGTKIKSLIDTDRVSVYTPFRIQEVRRENGKFTLIGSQFDQLRSLAGIDEIIVNSGARPDFSFLRELRVEFDSTVESVPALANF
ncbi:MAG: NAD(P)-binding domain-containing protein [Spirochaetia bacterium]|nr:NAD(P)-binding domain-containing protein [Spirochaetia bacterium]